MFHPSESVDSGWRINNSPRPYLKGNGPVVPYYSPTTPVEGGSSSIIQMVEKN